MPRVIVTRPAPQAAAWVARLQARGVDAAALPLIAIEPARDATPIVDAWSRLASFALVVFVSPNAVGHFFALRPAGAGWPGTVLAAAPGPGTAEALREAGIDAASVVEPDADAAQFDSEALWSRLGDRDWRGADVLVVRGDGGREWLSDRLGDVGAKVEAVAAYRRAAPVLGELEARTLAAACAAPREHAWLFSSSEAIGHLEQAAPACAWTAAIAIATHPRIAGRARDAGFGTVVEAQPSLEKVVACIQSMGP